MREWSITSWLHHLKKISSTQSIVQTLQSTSQVTTLWEKWLCSTLIIRELKQPRRWQQQKPHKSAYLTMKNSIFACSARVFFIFWHFEDVLVLSTMWNDLFAVAWTTWAHDDKFSLLYSYVPSAGSNLIPGYLEHNIFSSIMTLNNYWKMSAEMQMASVDAVCAYALHYYCN